MDIPVQQPRHICIKGLCVLHRSELFDLFAPPFPRSQQHRTGKMWKQAGRKVIDDVTRSSNPVTSRSYAHLGPSAMSTSKDLFPRMDADTSFAISTALAKIDQQAKSDVFYDPKSEATREAEDVSTAIAHLRSWLRLKVCRLRCLNA